MRIRIWLARQARLSDPAAETRHAGACPLRPRVTTRLVPTARVPASVALRIEQPEPTPLRSQSHRGPHSCAGDGLVFLRQAFEPVETWAQPPGRLELEPIPVAPKNQDSGAGASHSYGETRVRIRRPKRPHDHRARALPPAALIV